LHGTQLDHAPNIATRGPEEEPTPAEKVQHRQQGHEHEPVVDGQKDLLVQLVEGFGELAGIKGELCKYKVGHEHALDGVLVQSVAGHPNLKGF
jgi:hypothetical protein